MCVGGGGGGGGGGTYALGVTQISPKSFCHKCLDLIACLVSWVTSYIYSRVKKVGRRMSPYDNIPTSLFYLEQIFVLSLVREYDSKVSL